MCIGLRQIRNTIFQMVHRTQCLSHKTTGIEPKTAQDFQSKPNRLFVSRLEHVGGDNDYGRRQK